MEREPEEKFLKGKGNDVLSATEGNMEGRGSGGICDWRQGSEISNLGITSRSAFRERERITFCQQEGGTWRAENQAGYVIGDEEVRYRI
jgi:hypothetical protein